MFQQALSSDQEPSGGGSSGSGSSRPSPPLRSSSGRGFRRGSTWRESNANGPPRRMEVSIPHKSLKVFAQAVQCLMKVGKELFIETTGDQLILRTLNDAKSAFAAFYFNDSGGFFETFRCDASKDGFDSTQASSQAGGGGASVSCKVLVRAVHSILRTLKKVLRLVIYVEGEDEEHIEPHLVFQMYCEFGYRKVHRFSLQDCEIMHAVFEGEGASRLSCPPVQLSQLLEHIHGTAEVAVGASHDVLTVRSYHHPLTGAADRAVLKTEMSISTAEFDTYRFCGTEDEEVELVFSLKEIKALLHFSETTEAQTLEMLFREGGDPLLFQSHSKAFAAELIMATMEPKVIRKEPPPPTAVAAGGAKREPGTAAGSGRGGYPRQGDQSQESDARWREGDPGYRDGGGGRGGGASQDSEATRTPASHDQGFDHNPFGEQEPTTAGEGYTDGSASPSRRRGRVHDRLDGNEGEQQHRLDGGSYENDQSGGGGGGGCHDGGYEEERQARLGDGINNGRRRGASSDHYGTRKQHGDPGWEQEERGVEGGGVEGPEEAEDDVQQRDSELPTQFPGVREAFESELPTQFPGLGNDEDGGPGGGGGGGGGKARRGGNREVDEEEEEEDGGPVQGSKRRRRVVNEEEEE